MFTILFFIEFSHTMLLLSCQTIATAVFSHVATAMLVAAASVYEFSASDRVATAVAAAAAAVNTVQMTVPILPHAYLL